MEGKEVDLKPRVLKINWDKIDIKSKISDEEAKRITKLVIKTTKSF